VTTAIATNPNVRLLSFRLYGAGQTLLSGIAPIVHYRLGSEGKHISPGYVCFVSAISRPRHLALHLQAVQLSPLAAPDASPTRSCLTAPAPQPVIAGSIASHLRRARVLVA